MGALEVTATRRRHIWRERKFSWKLGTHSRKCPQLSFRVLLWERNPRCTLGSRLWRSEPGLELGVRMAGCNLPWNNAGEGRSKMGWRFISRD